VEGDETGTWQPFFEGDDSFLLAEIAGFPVDAIEKEKVNILNSFDGYDELLSKPFKTTKHLV
jgi:hypothetical protein